MIKPSPTTFADGCSARPIMAHGATLLPQPAAMTGRRWLEGITTQKAASASNDAIQAHVVGTKQGATRSHSVILIRVLDLQRIYSVRI